MQISYKDKYIKDKIKLISKNHLLENRINQTEELFQKDIANPKLRLHKIICKKDKNRYSITVINTQYRILATICEDRAVFLMLVNHKVYDRINKNC